MIYLRHIILSLIILCFAGPGFGQKHKSKPFFKGRYNAIRVSKGKARVMCPIFEESKYPYQGIGIKLGDPFAVTYKFYANKNLAIAIDFGSAASGLYNQYNTENFALYIQPDTLQERESISHLTHNVKSDWMGEAKILYQHDASYMAKGLQWYAGVGWQWRKTKITYEYFLEISFDENEIGKFNVSRFAMGPTGVLGLEYAYFDLPISTFLEIEVFSDVIEDPGWVRFQGGVGLRYVF